MNTTLKEIARRAGTTKLAIYRRWPSRPHLVLAALATRLGAARAPDTGCTLCDLNEGINVFIAAFQQIPPTCSGRYSPTAPRIHACARHS